MGIFLRVLIVLVSLSLAASALPSAAQVPKPQLTAPPCADPHNCRSYKPGAALKPPGASQGQKVACPAGTVYNPKRGTCRVVSSP